MGFVNVGTGLRALGYLERDPIPAGPVALVTHSGSVFSTLLRARRAFGFTLAVSSGQELVTTTADYLEYILEGDPADRVIALVAETIREPARMRAQLRRAAELDVPVVLLPVGGSPVGSELVAAHSGAVAGAGAMWEALCADTGAVIVRDLAELTDTLELLTLTRRSLRERRSRAGQWRVGAQRAGAPPSDSMLRGIATVHDSGAERALTADLAHELGVPFAQIGPATRERLAGLLDAGLEPSNPLDVWGTGASTRVLFRDCLLAMDADPAVEVTALAVDLVPEFDGDTSYPEAVLDAARSGAGPLVVLTGVASAVDDVAAAALRAAGVAVLEGTRSGLVALRNLLLLNGFSLGGASSELEPAPGEADRARRDAWRARLADPAPLGGAEAFALLRDYGVTGCEVRAAASADAAAECGDILGYPVVLKTDMPGVAHKSDSGGVILGLADADQVRTAYERLAAIHGPRVLVCAQAEAGIEVSVGFTLDPHLGPLLVVAAGGTLIELLADRVVACPPVTPHNGARMLRRLRIAPLLAGYRGAPGADLDALAEVVAGVSRLAAELGDLMNGLDVNPVIATPGGAIAVDVLVHRGPA
jgi:acyl-CoA synthetase (NDP forming)